MDPEKILLRFWNILGCQVQNDLKTLGNRFLGGEAAFLKKMSKIVDASGLERVFDVFGKREGANNLGGTLLRPQLFGRIFI